MANTNGTNLSYYNNTEFNYDKGKGDQA